MAETQQPMQRTSCFGNVRSLVLLNPKFLFAYNYIQNNYPRLQSFLRRIRLQMHHWHKWNSTELTMLIWHCCTCSKLLRVLLWTGSGPLTLSAPRSKHKYHALFTSLYSVDPSVSSADFFTYKKFCDNSNHFKHYGQECLYIQCTMWSSCVMRCVYNYWYPQEVFFFTFLFAQLHSNEY